MNHGQDAMVVLTWLCGTLSGALWGSSMEREEHKIARVYAYGMALCYSLCLLVIML